eukprot:7612939-Alexandrium_andersonii.AAC.1
MSASLVGSEMCIRDRFNDETTLQEMLMWLTPEVAANKRRGKAHAEFLDCLLYTSDAADDM